MGSISQLRHSADLRCICPGALVHFYYLLCTAFWSLACSAVVYTLSSLGAECEMPHRICEQVLPVRLYIVFSFSKLPCDLIW